MNSLNNKLSYLSVNLNKNYIKNFSKSFHSNKFSISVFNKISIKFFARTTAGSKAEIEKKWRDQLEGFKQNWQKVKDDNFEV